MARRPEVREYPRTCASEWPRLRLSPPPAVLERPRARTRPERGVRRCGPNCIQTHAQRRDSGTGAAVGRTGPHCVSSVRRTQLCAGATVALLASALADGSRPLPSSALLRACVAPLPVVPASGCSRRRCGPQREVSRATRRSASALGPLAEAPRAFFRRCAQSRFPRAQPAVARLVPQLWASAALRERARLACLQRPCM